MTWMERALCRSHSDPDLWFNEDKPSRQAAIEICRVCPVKEPCLTMAQKRKERYGIWSGIDFGEKERRRRYRWEAKQRETAA